MLQFCRIVALTPVRSYRNDAQQVTIARNAFRALLLLIGVVTSTAQAQSRDAGYTALHVPVNRFEFIASADSQPVAKPLAVHNGGMVRLTDVKLTRIAYADSARGSAWLVAIPRQLNVAPDELATVGMLCVDAAGLSAGTYRASAAVGARELREPVAITITLVVKDAGTHRNTARSSACR